MANSARKKIAILGGNFDPPHQGHVLTITAILNGAIVDEIWVVPVGDERSDKPPVAKADERRHMVQCMLEEYFKGAPVKINTVQLDGQLPGSFTVDLLARFRNEYPNYNFYFVVGLDNLNAIRTWREGERLLKEVNWIVMPRPGYLAPELDSNFSCLNGKEVAQCSVSSSLVRGLVRAGKQIGGMVPSTVAGFIMARKLYV